VLKPRLAAAALNARGIDVRIREVVPKPAALALGRHGPHQGLQLNTAGPACYAPRVPIDLTLAAFPPTSTSVGVAWFGRPDGDFPAMIGAADELMYEIKQKGKRGVLVRAFPRRAVPEGTA
jgi:hypothetical protein